jgi:hypothetical protein
MAKAMRLKEALLGEYWFISRRFYVSNGGLRQEHDSPWTSKLQPERP